MRYVRFLLFPVIIIMLNACAHHSVPKQVPEVGMDVIGAYNRPLSVQFINDQDDTTPQLFWAAGVHRWYADYNVWTQFFIDNLSNELTKRGVSVSDQSPNRFKVKLSDFAAMQGFAVIRVNMKIKLEREDERWVREWTASDTSGWSGGRALGSVIYNATQKLLTDEEFVSKMRGDRQ